MQAQENIELYGKDVWNSFIWFQIDPLFPSQSLIENNNVEDSCPHEFAVPHQFYARDR